MAADSEVFIERFLKYTIRNNVSNLETLLELRGLSPLWQKYIEQYSSEVRNYLTLDKKLNELLYVDEKIYNQYYYPRILILNRITPIMDEYEKVLLPGVIDEEIEDDLDDGVKQIIHRVLPTNMALPREFKLFLSIYRKYPHVAISLYFPSFLHKVATLQVKIARSYEFRDNSFLTLLTPLCYTKHYQLEQKDSQYLIVLFHFTPLGKRAQELTPDERYFVHHLAVKNLENEEEHQVALLTFMENIMKTIAENKEETNGKTEESEEEEEDESIFEKNVPEIEEEVETKPIRSLNAEEEESEEEESEDDLFEDFSPEQGNGHSAKKTYNKNSEEIIESFGLQLFEECCQYLVTNHQFGFN